MTTIQDIKKALEICSEDDGCRECPYYDYHHCDKALLKDALALINEQNQTYQEQKIKQAQIDVLNKLKERAIGYTFLGEKLATETDIDGLIEEVENETKKETSRSTL